MGNSMTVANGYHDPIWAEAYVNEFQVTKGGIGATVSVEPALTANLGAKLQEATKGGLEIKPGKKFDFAKSRSIYHVTIRIGEKCLCSNLAVKKLHNIIVTADCSVTLSEKGSCWKDEDGYMHQPNNQGYNCSVIITGVK